jgi:hypothetical protein
MRFDRLPMVILGGSDLEPADLPDNVRGKHPLSVYKGAHIRIEGKPLIHAIAERLKACGAFDPIYVAGPADVYRQIDAPTEIIDTDGTFGDNIRAGIEHLQSTHPGSAVAFVTCDILPDAEILRRLMAQCRQDAPFDVWFPMVRAPEDDSRLGASAWKPKYKFVPGEGQPAIPILPGHLAVGDLAALRLDFLYRLLTLGYSVRNRPLSYRSTVIVRDILGGLLYEDLRHALALRAPTMTATVIHAGLSSARRMHRGILSTERLEWAMRQIFVRRSHRLRFPERRFRMPIVDDLALALDIDTEEEARQVGGAVERRSSA